ncbi:MAG: acetyl-CoA carboxylase, carboxyltransferase subunit beta [Saprospiraceae bacterium]|nr:acetyl-CoA carboxylase carboxyltransferase subunit beta [Saprospiraceae bacterium]MCB9342470.1 acetyl-CoA carboxylase carboxyltransferase subunit beta [Lewinellaceae bacterium]
MSWYKRLREGISTATKAKKDVPEGVWFQCKKCKETSTTKALGENFYKCPKCDYHTPIGSATYFDILFDNQEYITLHDNLVSVDFLGFTDLKPYDKRLDESRKKTGLNDALAIGAGEVMGHRLVIAAMDFRFIGGSMGSVVGEKISLAIDNAIENQAALMIISKSGGARMMESAFSLMQMAKTSAKLTLMAKAGLPYFSLLTDPTTGGVTASFAMLGDINLAEPGALIGFAGPRVIRETIKRDLPEGFQTSEFLLDKGFVDLVVNRKDLRETVGDLLAFFEKQDKKAKQDKK